MEVLEAFSLLAAHLYALAQASAQPLQQAVWTEVVHVQVVASLVEQPAHLVHPHLTVVALHPRLFNLLVVLLLLEVCLACLLHTSVALSMLAVVHAAAVACLPVTCKHILGIIAWTGSNPMGSSVCLIHGWASASKA